jgi:uncharacterized protein with ParB-like and HNH nuclease domain
MGLTLSAEQKNISNLLSGRIKYIIPEYQRPYSWDKEQCLELIDDLKQSFKNEENGYFLGNIVVAGSLDESSELEVIDGQQRLTTLTILMRVLLSFDKDNLKLKNSIWELDDRTNEIIEPRLTTKVFSGKDSKYLSEIIDIDFRIEDLEEPTKSSNQYKKNMYLFYKEIQKIGDKIEIQNFVDYILYKASLLPIQTDGRSKESAREKALKIFETINDRGKSLNDSDIFKAKLYNKALNKKEDNEFIKRWNNLNEECIEIKYNVDEIFKLYTHVIRGEKGLKGTESKLRDFFNRKDESPFKNEDKAYSDILSDLELIIESIKLYKDLKTDIEKYPNITKWLQIIDEHSNQYSYICVIVYMYKHNLADSNNLEINQNNFIVFCKDLIRYTYYVRTTSKMQFKIYDFIIKIMNNKSIEYDIGKIERSSFDYLGRLKKGFALIALYLDEQQNVIHPYYFDNIINERDCEDLDDSWEKKLFNEYIDTLGQMIITDFPKKHMKLKNKLSYFKKSKFSYLHSLSIECEDWTYDKYIKRNDELLDRLVSFFEVKNENN